MKLPSLHTIYKESREAFRRFPMVLLAAASGTAAALILADKEGPASPNYLYAILLSSALAIPVFFLITLVTEALRPSVAKTILLNCAGAALCVLYFFIVPRDLYNAPFYHYYIFIILLFSACMMVFAAPFFLPGRASGFWYFNVQLIVRFAVSTFFSQVLNLGLFFALHSLDPLFGIDISATRFFQLWIVMFGLFNVWFFLGTVPDSLNEPADTRVVMKPLKVFVQYILMPILAVYLVILYAYIAKILFTLTWPRGWVSKLILGYGITGFAAYVLAYPLRDERDAGWVKTLWKWFLISLIPLDIVYFLALLERIGQYGLTENRLVGFVLCAWFLLAIVYFLFLRKNDIRMVPLSLGVLAVLSGIGPWSIFSVAENSQVERLRSELTKHSILVNGRIIKPPDGKIMKPSAENNRINPESISGILAYLYEQHGYAKIQPWFGATLHDSTYNPADNDQIAGSWKEPKAVAGLMGIEFSAPSHAEIEGGKLITIRPNDAIDIKGYDMLTAVQVVNAVHKEKMMNLNGLFVFPALNSGYISFSADSLVSGTNAIRISFKEQLHKLASQAVKFEMAVPASELTFEGESPKLKVRVFVIAGKLERSGDSEKISWVRLQACFSVKE